MDELKWKYERTVTFSEPITDDENKYLNDLLVYAHKLKTVKDRTRLKDTVKILFIYLKL